MKCEREEEGSWEREDKQNGSLRKEGRRRRAYETMKVGERERKSKSLEVKRIDAMRMKRDE